MRKLTEEELRNFIPMEIIAPILYEPNKDSFIQPLRKELTSTLSQVHNQE